MTQYYEGRLRQPCFSQTSNCTLGRFSHRHGGRRGNTKKAQSTDYASISVELCSCSLFLAWLHLRFDDNRVAKAIRQHRLFALVRGRQRALAAHGLGGCGRGIWLILIAIIWPPAVILRAALAIRTLLPPITIGVWALRVVAPFTIRALRLLSPITFRTRITAGWAGELSGLSIVALFGRPAIGGWALPGGLSRTWIVTALTLIAVRT